VHEKMMLSLNDFWVLEYLEPEFLQIAVLIISIVDWTVNVKKFL
jgi:hypothetical protein